MEKPTIFLLKGQVMCRSDLKTGGRNTQILKKETAKEDNLLGKETGSTYYMATTGVPLWAQSQHPTQQGSVNSLADLSSAQKNQVEAFLFIY